MVYKTITEKGGIFNLKKEEVTVECQVEELLPHLEAFFIGETIVECEPLGYLSDD